MDYRTPMIFSRKFFIYYILRKKSKHFRRWLRAHNSPMLAVFWLGADLGAEVHYLRAHHLGAYHRGAHNLGALSRGGTEAVVALETGAARNQAEVGNERGTFRSTVAADDSTAALHGNRSAGNSPIVGVGAGHCSAALADSLLAELTVSPRYRRGREQ